MIKKFHFLDKILIDIGGTFRSKNKFLIRSTICMNALLYLTDVFPDC